jgi:hypothetical protein
MKIIVSTIGRSGSSELIDILKNKNIDVISKPYNILYPNKILEKYGRRDVKVIFITRNIIDVIKSLINCEKDKGIEWIKMHYKNLNADYNDYPKLLEQDTLNFEKLFDAYNNNNNNNIFPTIFIKYENLYFGDIKTLQMLNNFLNTNFTTTDFKYNTNNKWKTTPTISLTDINIKKITNTFKSLQNKINSYTVKYKVSPQYLIDKIVLLIEANSLDGKRHYRFSDVIIHSGFYWEESTKFILEHDNFKGTILRNYIELCPHNNLKEKNINYITLLKKIINDKIKTNNFDLPNNDELVIHLRLGDMCELPNFLKKDYIIIIKEYIEKFNISKVTFCTAFHYGNNITQNCWMYTDKKHETNIVKLKELFTKIIELFNIIIDVKSSIIIDNDFIYMVKARHFVEDIGGFSKLIKELNTKNI